MRALLNPRGTVCAVFAVALLAIAPTAGRAASTDDLGEAFRTCLPLDRHPLAGALMRSLVNPKGPRELLTFRNDFRELTQTTVGNVGTATLTLQTGQVNGMKMRTLSASTCVDGCGIAVWSLEFWAPSRADLDRFRRWVAQAPTSRLDTGEVQVRLIEAPNALRIECDLSN